MGTSTQIVKQETSNIPEYARPYYEDLLQRGQAESYRPYIPYGYTQDPYTGKVVRATTAAKEGEEGATVDWNAYLAANPDVAAAAKAAGGDAAAFAKNHYDTSGKEEGRGLTYSKPEDAQRLQGFTPAQKKTQTDVLDMTTPGQFGSADASMRSGLNALAATQNYDPAQFRAQRIQAPSLQQYQQQGPQQFGQEQAQQYMSPYVQNVLNIQKQQAIADAQKGQLTQNLGAARQGTYGGSRQLLAATERERALGQQLGNIEATGLQSAYESAQQQFERDRAAQMGVGTTNLNALLGVQSLGANTGLQAALANQQQNLEAQRLSEASQQFGANLGLQGAQAYGQMGQTYANLGTAQQQADLQRFNAQNAIGAQEQAQGQQGLDIRYGDFLRQQNYPMEQLGLQSNILRGLPTAVNTTQTTSAPAPSVLGQVAGAGLSALGYAKLLG